MNKKIRIPFFTIALIWRITYGISRTLLGFAMLEIVGMPLIDILNKIMAHELQENPPPAIYALIQHTLTNHPMYITYFLATYFIFWGTTDAILSYNMLKKRLWAFPLAIISIIVFTLYEMIRFSHTHSLILLSVIVLDILICALITREYLKNKKETSDKNIDDSVSLREN